MPKQENNNGASYTAKDIYVLKGLEPVRKRPAMYIGSTGPDGVHHLIWEVTDNSVTYNTPVFIRKDGAIKIEKIGELIDNAFQNGSHLIQKSLDGKAEILRDLPLETLSFDTHGLKLKFQSVFSLIRHKVNSEIYKITLQNGRQVEITPYHSLFTLQNGIVLPIKGESVQVGTPIVVPKAWPETENPIQEIDLIDELLKLSPQKTQSLNINNLSLIFKNDANLSWKFKQTIPQYVKSRKGSLRHRANVWQDYIRYDYLPFNILRAVDSQGIVAIKDAALLSTRHNPKIRLNSKIKINSSLIELLGVFTAEGCIVKSHNDNADRVVFGLGAHENDLISYVCSSVKQVFGFEVRPHYVHETARTVAIDSYLIALIFQEIFKTGKNSSDKKVPDLIFNLNSILRARYLIGYLSGDGYPTKIWKKHLIESTSPLADEKQKFSLVGKSQQLVSSFSYLLSSLQKSYCYQEILLKRPRGFININYKGKITKKSFNAQPRIFRIDFYWNTNSSYINYLPFNEVIGDCYDRPTINKWDSGQAGISSNKVLTLLAEKRIVLKQDALKFLNSDLGILRVRKIEKIKYSYPWVYDISVKNDENFVGGFSPVCLHNSLDEALAGYCTEIEVTLLANNRVKCVDNGRGIPVEKHPDTGTSTLETVMTTLHAGGKFGGTAYKVAGGLHGVGVSVVCALSKFMRAEVCRDGVKWAQEYSQGKVKTKVEKAGVCRQTGTTVIFEPDKEIFKEINFDLKRILSHLRQQAYLTSGVKIIIKDERREIFWQYQFYFEGGLKSYVKHLVAGAEKRHGNIFYGKGEKEGVAVEAALQYIKEFECLEESFANNINTGEGGMHLTGFRTALTRTINDYARKNNYLKEKEENLTGNDVREGLVAAVSVKMRDTQFEGQTKAKLGNPEAKTAVEAVVGDLFAEFLEKNPSDARAIVETCLLSAKARKAAKAARTTVLRKGVLDGMSLPGKLADCISKEPADSELYIVEGDSAGGCFSGDTKIALVDGRNLSFLELVKEEQVGKKNYCYTIKNNGSLGVSLIKNVRRTKRQARVIKIILDNKEEIICTPDHRFMMRNGEYKEAQNIIQEDSLMPLCRQVSKKGGLITIDGYEMTFCPASHRWIFTHLLADKYNLEKEIYQKERNYVIHHKDYNKLNNNPDNLFRMEKMEHLIFHATVARDNLSKPETLAKIREAHQSKEYRERISQTMSKPEMRQMLSERAKKQWESDEYKKFMAEKFLDFYKNNEEYRKKNNKLLNSQQKSYWALSENRDKQSERVKKFFQENPEVKKLFSEFSKKQWQNEELLKWRSEKTKEQWTSDFRAKRKQAYNQTYLQKALKLLKEVLEQCGKVDNEKYNLLRRAKNDKSIIKYDTICQRFFNGDEQKLKDTVMNFNHKIKQIVPLSEKIGVFDLEVEGTHNFALSSGVFVHNSSKMARDRRFQAILPLRGKILNVERARLDKLLSSEEIKNLIIALGTAIAQDFDINNLRYHRIIIMSDADVDGSHIRTLLLTLFFRHFREVIEKGYVYIAQPPLYKIKWGKRLEYAYNDAEKEEILGDILKEKANVALAKKKAAVKVKAVEGATAELLEEAVSASSDAGATASQGGVFVQRYKGLGEMNPDELWETTMNPQNRVLLKVTIEDAAEADRIFDVLMGQEVAPRKKFIQVHAKNVKNLDI